MNIPSEKPTCFYNSLKPIEAYRVSHIIDMDDDSVPSMDDGIRKDNSGTAVASSHGPSVWVEGQEELW